MDNLDREADIAEIIRLCTPEILATLESSSLFSIRAILELGEWDLERAMQNLSMPGTGNGQNMPFPQKDN